MLNEGNQIHNFISSSASGTVINHGSGSGTDFFTSYGSDSGSGSTSQKVTAPTVPVPQRCIIFIILDTDLNFLVEWILIRIWIGRPWLLIWIWMWQNDSDTTGSESTTPKCRQHLLRK
jgi:hypothetical protein